MSLPAAEPSPPGSRRAVAVLLAGAGALAVAALWHLTQGTAELGLTDVAAAIVGTASDRAAAVLEGSRLPRLAAGVVAGAALGMAGTLLQSITRNPLAAPGTLGVNAGAHLAVVVVAVSGAGLGPLAELGTAFLGAAAAAALVAGVAAGVRMTPARLVLAGVAVTLALGAVTATLIILFEQRTAGLFFWGQGTLVQTNGDAVGHAWPRLAVAGGAALLLARPLDVLALGEDTASALGVRVRRLQLAGVAVAVLLAAVAVTVAGPIGFVGLVAPHVVRLLGVRRHLPLMVGAALWGAVMLVGADAAARTVRSTALSSELPAGVVTALVGAPFFLWLARRASRTGGDVARDRTTGRLTRTWPPTVAIAVGAGALAVALVAGLVLGDLRVSPSELWAVVAGGGSELHQRVVLGLRLPRLLVAALAGGALAVSGALLQGVTRNPLAAPSVIGVTGGAAVGALGFLLVVPGADPGLVPAAAFLGAAAAAATVYLLAWRTLGSPTTLLLVGVAVAAFTTALVAALVVGAEVRTAQALTWLAGSTYARTWQHAVALGAWLLPLLPAAWAVGRRLDLLALGDDVPRTLGVRLGRTRLTAVTIAVLLAAAAVAVVGTLGFVGLLAPHAARLLVGARHRRLVPAAALVGGTLVVVADTVGRTVIAPAQIPAGLVTALLGAPYFVWLLYRTRRA